ncbi:hypothetical protein L596_008697 [Steinernema carpocapsae]|uniref:Uncharacterized protein n=1 Tax=Steinernema carpocapsae TaxID=34508 RepID=A0A4U5PED9_STECR|nr:hypothetical protein L596_008697 [Steinernema carpocapsae]
MISRRSAAAEPPSFTPPLIILMPISPQRQLRFAEANFRVAPLAIIAADQISASSALSAMTLWRPVITHSCVRVAASFLVRACS